eukprot:CAMPEP_0206266496 /NCGR_PEP_ID=MMETSP0047_2-20121206/30606_1 /ASSEMBLY_ACC=CAM_ASM_000192 /TAXON_ID=195065 /ORGANISM="Chroomonas mesostigmatica_cf, Strain CCMP1168" /LENGTH=232 /DNA_ID=CAMNT_0053694555 /DNA_START=64 /DNA_END=758 /DNA_ORIENTATION=-
MSSAAAEELAKKKARLAELRKAKEARSEASKRPAAPSVEDLLAAAGVPSPEPESPAPPPAKAPSPEAAAPPGGGHGSLRERMARLSVSADVIVDIPAKPRERYEKITQTDVLDEPPPTPGGGEEPRSPEPGRPGDDLPASPERVSKDAEKEAEGAAEKGVPTLSEEEVDALINTAEFKDFFGKTTKFMERALGQRSYDFLKDYSEQLMSEGEEERQKLIFKTLTLRDEQHTG